MWGYDRRMDEPWTVRRLRAWIAPHLASRGVDSPQACADLLLSQALGCARLNLYMDADRPATVEELTVLRAFVRRAVDGEPVQYIVGSWGFYGHDFAVDRSTLIPRPSTETLVDEVLAVLREPSGASRGECARTIVDLCTGSGCIAIAVAATLAKTSSKRHSLAWSRMGPAVPQGNAPVDTALADIRIVATDLVPEAIALAKGNAQRLGVDRWIEFLEGDLDAPLAGRGLEGAVDVLCANPPYISDAEWAEVPKNVRDFEPATALRGGVDGLAVIRRIVAVAPNWLRPGGALVVEVAASQGASVALAATVAGFTGVRVVKDLEGHDRVIVARTAAPPTG